MRKHSCCLIIPSYNNGIFLEAFLQELKNYASDIIVVNDGSTDETAAILARHPDLWLVSFPENRGKGAALRSGFEKAAELGFRHVISMDSDSQHRPKDLVRFLEVLEENGESLVVGSRHMDHEHMPEGNRFANRFSSFWYRVATGLRVKDTQSGFRLYPLETVQGIRTLSGRYEYELEVLVRTAWRGVPIREVPIDVHYPPGDQRISHFRPFADFMRITLLNFLLIFLGLAYYRPRLAFRKYRNKTWKQIFREDIIGSNTPLHIIALSVAFGIFMGILPIWGYQLVVGLFFAHLLKLNKAVFFIAANISIPPMIPAVLYMSYVTGSYVLGDGSWTVDVELNLASIGQNLKQYLLGAVVFAGIAGTVAGAFSFGFLSLYKKMR